MLGCREESEKLKPPGLGIEALPSILPKLASVTDDMRRWLFARVAPDPVNGAKDARFADDIGSVVSVPALEMSRGEGIWLVLRLSLCSFISPRLKYCG